jgi:hypothetical protein
MENLAAAKVATYISVISYYHKIQNVTDFTQQFIIKETLLG